MFADYRKKCKIFRMNLEMFHFRDRAETFKKWSSRSLEARFKSWGLQHWL